MEKAMLENKTSDVIVLTGRIVAAYVENNALPVANLESLIADVHAALMAASGAAVAVAKARRPERPTPSQIRKSITDQEIISFLDGRPYKTLRRHLTSHGLDPRTYRERFDLPSDYPMVAPNYARQRSTLAKQIGLGRPGALGERLQQQSVGSD
jgi:predicted transcriptional regulator